MTAKVVDYCYLLLVARCGPEARCRHRFAVCLDKSHIWRKVKRLKVVI